MQYRHALRSFLVITALAVGPTALRAAPMARPEASAARPTEPMRAEPRPRTGKELGRVLSDRKLYRELSPTLTDRQASEKFARARLAPESLVRSYASVFWRLTREAPPERNLGAIGPAFGDAHEENFGWLRLDGKTVFGVSDLDDGGRAPVGEDAAHYFTTLRLRYRADQPLVERVLARYAEVVVDPRKAVELDARLAPDWKAEEQQALASDARGDRFRYKTNPDLRKVKPSERTRLTNALAADPRLSGLKIVDVAEFIRVQGGSGGLARYWLLVDPGAGAPRKVLELKELGTPGVAESGIPQTADQRQRVGELRDAFWGGAGKDDWKTVAVGGKTFILRDKQAQKGIDLGALSASAREQVLLAQVSYMAGVHRAGWAGIGKAEIERAVDARSKLLAKGYKKAQRRLAR